MKKVLITGGAGYVGTVLAQELVNRDYKVEVVDLLWFGDYLPDGVKVHQKSILDLAVPEVSSYDAVVYLGGLSNDPMANYNPAMNFVENAAVPSYLAFICKEAGVKRFVYASSCSVYGYTDNQLMDEEGDVSPQYPYGISKLAAERAIMNLSNEVFRPIALRKGTVGGYSPRMRFDLVVNTMTKTALTEGIIRVHNPSIWRPLIDIQDVATAYICAIEAPSQISGVYNILEDNYTIGALAEQVQSTLFEHGHQCRVEINNIKDVRNYKVSNERAKQDLIFFPERSPSHSVDSILKNFDKNADLTAKRFHNIRVFKEDL